MPLTAATDDSPRSGACAIVGRANAGKSTLLNTLLRRKLAIATPRPGTTRTRILGVYLCEDPPTQIAFVDTPGLHTPRNALGRALVQSARQGLLEAEVVLLVTEVDVRRPDDADAVLAREERRVLGLAGDRGLPVVLAINKIDRLRDRRQLLPLIDACSERFAFGSIVPISALKKDNTGALPGAIREHLAEGLRYDEEMLTDKPERFFVAELVREAAIMQTGQEVPYCLGVYVDAFREKERLTSISAVIVVEKQAHKGILIGKGGKKLKSIGTAARRQIERFLGRKVFLELWVKVREGWTEAPADVRRLAVESTGSDD
jgi:GTP-binding protein Era